MQSYIWALTFPITVAEEFQERHSVILRNNFRIWMEIRQVGVPCALESLVFLINIQT
jgi:hypothetical protein